MHPSVCLCAYKDGLLLNLQCPLQTILRVCVHSLVLTDPLYVELRHIKRYPMATLPMSSSSKSTQPFLRIEQAPDTLSNGWVLPRKHHNIDTADPRDNTFIGLRGGQQGHPIQLYCTIDIRGNVPVQKYTALRYRRNALPSHAHFRLEWLV